jgi:hypothetical protein
MQQLELTEELDSRQIAALESLLSGNNITEASAIAGVSRTTLSRWVNHDYAFRTALREARTAAVQAAQSRIQELSPAIVDALANIALDTAAGRRDRTQAAAKLLDLAYRSIDTDELERRISALESRFE